MPPTINELRVEVTTNAFCKMQYFPLFDSIDIVLDQSPYNNKSIQGSLTTHNNIYRSTSSLFFFPFLKNSNRDLRFKNKKTRGEAWKMCNSHGQRFFGRIAY